MLRTKMLLAMLCVPLIAGCNQPGSTPATAPPTTPAVSASQPNRAPVNPREFAAPEETLAELNKTPVTLLDLGLYRLHQELVPDIDKQLRSKGLLPPPSVSRNPIVAGFVSVGMVYSNKTNTIEISVATPQTDTVASDITIAQLQEQETKIVSAVRAYFGGGCAGNESPGGPGYRCQPAIGFYEYFQHPSVNSFNQPMVAQYRAQYNLYSLIQISVRGSLNPTVIVSCGGPMIRDEVKCTTSGYP